MMIFCRLRGGNYSSFNVFTGLATAALTLNQAVVAIATISSAPTGPANCHQASPTRNAYPCIHRPTSQYASGIATSPAQTTNTTRSRVSSYRILGTEAPSVFRIPISFVLLAVE